MNFTALTGRTNGYVLLLAGLMLFVLLGLYCAHVMDMHGHIITGMNNHVVWGLPHVFAISLIVAASGALNGASLSSVFGVSEYKPFARVSVWLAISLLVGGLLVLVLDLGRPDRLIVAMTHFNFKSIFTWNIFLYTGFIFIGIIYLIVMIERPFNHMVGKVGMLAFIWRLILTTGTGSIFGFLVGRDALDSALLAPLFIAVSFALGMAMLTLCILFAMRWREETANEKLLLSLKQYLRWFLVAVLYFSIVHHLTNLYIAEHSATQQFALFGPFSIIFWLGHVVIGVIVPWFLLRGSNGISRLVSASFCAIIGSACLLYAIIIGSQSTPQRLFPGKTVTSSTFGDAGFALYQPSVWEWGLGFGGIADALLLCTIGLRLFPFLPPKVSTGHIGQDVGTHGSTGNGTHSIGEANV